MFELISSQFATFWSNLSDLIEILIRIPRALVGGKSQSSIAGRMLLLVLQVIWFPIYAAGWLVLAPLRVLTDFSARRQRDFVYGIPVLICGGFIVFVLTYVNVQADAINKKYRTKGQALMTAENFDAAKTYYGRIISDKSNEALDADIYNWAIILGKTGEPTRAAAILDKLAPADKVGYHLAHRLKAVNMAKSLARSTDPLALRKLRWHLENSRDYSATGNQVWAVYYMAVNQPENALTCLEKAAEENPANLLDIARLHNQLGNKTAHRRTVARAEHTFRQLVENDPLDSANRVSLANLLVQLDKMDEAETELLTGIRLQADPLILRSTADYYVMRHDLARADEASFAVQFEFLQKAMNLDVNYPATYQRFIELYHDNQNKAELAEIKTAIMETVTGDKPSALSHFSLSNLYLMEGDDRQAEWHLEQAYNLDPNFVVVLNNLAWTLATKPEPDLDRAYELVKKVVERVPEDARFRDTLATVLMKQEKYTEAVLEFEKALLTIANKQPLHEKLALIYEKLGQPELASLHAKRAGSLQ